MHATIKINVEEREMFIVSREEKIKLLRMQCREQKELLRRLIGSASCPSSTSCPHELPVFRKIELAAVKARRLHEELFSLTNRHCHRDCEECKRKLCWIDNRRDASEDDDE